jgi:hypothetical protein
MDGTGARVPINVGIIYPRPKCRGNWPWSLTENNQLFNRKGFHHYTLCGIYLYEINTWC